MAVSVPRINPIQPTDTQPKNDRINLQVRDQGSQILQQTGAVAAIGGKIGDIYQAAENEKIDQLSTEAEAEYNNWNKQQLAKIKTYEGDPTDAYVEYEKAAAEKRQAIVDSRPDLNDRVKRHFTSRLDNTVKKSNVEADYQRGMQQEVYANNVFESGVKLKKDSLSTMAGYIQKGDPDSYAMFDDNLSEMKTMIAKRGLAKGTVQQLPDDAEKYSHSYRDDDGKLIKVNMSDAAKVRVAKETSEGVRASLEAMIAGGDIETAKEMRDRYKTYLDPKSAAAIDKKFETAGRKDEAYSVIGSIRGKSPEEQMRVIDSIKDPELRSEALKIKDADDRRVENMKERKQKANYETLGNNVIAKMNSSEPFFGIADLENDPVYKNTYDNMSPKQKLAIKEMIEAPKESNPKSLIAVQELFFGADSNIETMTPAEFAEKTVGLSKADKTAWTNKFNSLRTQSEGEKRAMYKQAGTMLRDQLLLDKYVKRDKFGKISGNDEIKMIKAQQALNEHLGTQTGVFRPEQLQKFVKQFSAAEIKGQIFNPPPRTPMKNDSRSTASDVILPEGDKLLDLKRQYRQEFKKFPVPGDAHWLNYAKRKS